MGDQVATLTGHYWQSWQVAADNNENEHIGDEDLGEDKYEKTQDLLVPKKKKTDLGDQGNLKYDLNDFDDDMLVRHKKQKDVQFP